MSLAKVYTALTRMRELTQAGIPFSLSFQSYSEQRATTNGIKSVEKAMLRPGITKGKSDKSEILIAYHDLTTNTHGTLYLPLLLIFNGNKLQ